VPYDGDPERVTPMPGARRAPARLRAAAVDRVLGAGARRR
jgi:hypothetical protein